MQSPTCRRTHQRFHAVKGTFPQQSADQQSLEQNASWNPETFSTVSRKLHVGSVFLLRRRYHKIYG